MEFGAGVFHDFSLMSFSGGDRSQVRNWALSRSAIWLEMRRILIMNLAFRAEFGLNSQFPLQPVFHY